MDNLICKYRYNGAPCLMRARRRGLCKQHFEQQLIAPIRKELFNSQAIVRQLATAIKELENELDYTYDAEVIAPKPRDMFVCSKCKKRYDSVPETMQHERFCRGPKAKRVTVPKAANMGQKSARKIIVDFDNMQGGLEE